MSNGAIDSGIADPLTAAITADRQTDAGRSRELADRYLQWRDALLARDVKPWEDRKARRYIEGAWLWEGRPSVIFAGQGRGKSNFAAWVIEKVLETRPEWDVFTNLPFPWDPEGGGPPAAEPWGRIHPVGSLSEVLRGAVSSVRAGRKPSVIIDEMDQAVTSHDWMSDDARSWQRLLNIERHLRLRGPLLVYHAYRHIPVVLREGTMLKSLLQVIVMDGRRWVIRREEDGFLQIPPTVLPYLAYGLRGFDIDVDVRELERNLHGSSEAVGRQIMAYLDQERAKQAAQYREKAERRNPPVCEDCGAPFSRRDAMMRHQRSVHGRGE